MISIDTSLIKKLKHAGFFPDTMFTSLFILESMETPERGIPLLDELDDSSSSKRMILLYYDLVRRGFLLESDDETFFIITQKGKDFLESLRQAEKIDLNKWFTEWLELWPKGVTTGGKLVRSDTKTCVTKLNKFFKDYNYPPDIVMNATKKYVQSFESTQYAYMKAATYFIDKRGEGSELASWCEKELNTESDEPIYADNGLI